MSESHTADGDIRRLHAGYVFFADRARIDDLVGLFTPDGVYRNVGGAYDGLVHSGAPAIRKYLASVVTDLGAVGVTGTHRHHVSPAYVEFSGAREARAESYFLALRASGPDHWGVYRDRLVRLGDHWRFAERVCRIEGTSADSWQHEVGELRRVRASTGAMR
ncbi:nuclear transport factor 2 family protein [Dactylosporangium sucinum]|uniref:SnoaL-like domain-containing protein n=1 Tax=Dactylosporangium sucinum TaxID=1424081 RepID=A0A917X489_9ACTN|nr:nuclear transport factor 2 family protein [Dactylosporangium sucinum]GGM64393.1 hypothetical protein GCM10007977_077360 [Dactylosporangium sucinum]